MAFQASSLSEAVILGNDTVPCDKVSLWSEWPASSSPTAAVLSLLPCTNTMSGDVEHESELMHENHYLLNTLRSWHETQHGILIMMNLMSLMSLKYWLLTHSLDLEPEPEEDELYRELCKWHLGDWRPGSATPAQRAWCIGRHVDFLVGPSPVHWPHLPFHQQKTMMPWKSKLLVQLPWLPFLIYQLGLLIISSCSTPNAFWLLLQWWHVCMRSITFIFSQGSPA